MWVQIRNKGTPFGALTDDRPILKTPGKLSITIKGQKPHECVKLQHDAYWLKPIILPTCDPISGIFMMPPL